MERDRAVGRRAVWTDALAREHGRAVRLRRGQERGRDTAQVRRAGQERAVLVASSAHTTRGRNGGGGMPTGYGRSRRREALEQKAHATPRHHDGRHVAKGQDVLRTRSRRVGVPAESPRLAERLLAVIALRLEVCKRLTPYYAAGNERWSPTDCAVVKELERAATEFEVEATDIRRQFTVFDAEHYQRLQRDPTAAPLMIKRVAA